MEKRDVFILMQFFLALWLPSTLQMPTCASFVKGTFTAKPCIHLIKEKKRMRDRGLEGEFYLLLPSSLPPRVGSWPTGRLFTSSRRSSAQAAAQPGLCGVTKCSSCHSHETEHICLEMFSACSDLGHGNLRTFPNPGLISLVQLDYWRMQLTKGTYYL